MTHCSCFSWGILNRHRLWEDVLQCYALIGRNRNDCPSHMLRLGSDQEIAPLTHIIFLLYAHSQRWKGSCPALHTICAISSVCSFHHSFYTLWFLLEVYVYSELVRFEVQDMSNIYFYLILLGGLLDSTLLPVFGKRFYSLFPCFSEKDLYYKYINLLLLQGFICFNFENSTLPLFCLYKSPNSVQVGILKRY